MNTAVFGLDRITLIDFCQRMQSICLAESRSNAQPDKHVTATSTVPSKDSRLVPRCFCWIDCITNGLSYADRVQHALMCVGMKLPTEADFVFCFIIQKASRASRCFWPPVSNAQYRLQHQHPLSLCTENYLEKMVLKWNANCVKFRLETGQPQIHRNWTKA